jgi:hypothetical protein
MAMEIGSLQDERFFLRRAGCPFEALPDPIDPSSMSNIRVVSLPSDDRLVIPCSIASAKRSTITRGDERGIFQKEAVRSQRPPLAPSAKSNSLHIHNDLNTRGRELTAMAPPSLDALNDATLDCVLLALAGDVQDLLRLSRTSRHYHEAVMGADHVWRAAYEASFGAPAAAPPPGTWLAAFKERFQQEARRRRQMVAARRLKASSDVQSLEVEVHRLRQALAAEETRLPILKREQAGLRVSMHADAMRDAHTQYWAPVAVTRATGRQVAQVPQNAAARERALEQAVAEAELEAHKLRRRVTARAAALEAARRKLAALGP